MWQELAGRRIQLQLGLTCLTGLLIAALNVFLISDAVTGAEQILLRDAANAVNAAVSELALEGADRALQETDWRTIPLELKNVSLTGVSQAALRSFPGVEGGYWSNGSYLGYSYPTHLNAAKKTDMPKAESSDIQIAVLASLQAQTAQRIVKGATEAIVIGAKYNADSTLVSWAMKRVTGLGDAGRQQRRWWLAALVSAALLSLLATLATAAGLARGVRSMKAGLTVLEQEFHRRLPEGSGELGDIARAINRMVVKREALEQELSREDRLRFMGRLIATVAHEIRNPLNGIRLTAQLMQKQASRSGVLNPEEPHQLELIIAEIDRLDAMVHDFLVFESGRLPSLELQPLLPAVQRAAVLAHGGMIGTEQIQFGSLPASSRAPWIDLIPPGETLESAVETVERVMIERALHKSAGNKTKASEVLGIHRRLL